MNKQRADIPRSPGRPKGSVNKVTGAVKDMILEALSNVGGVKYLQGQAKDNPTAFLTLVGKVIPLQVSGDPDNPLIFASVDVSHLSPEQIKALASVRLSTDA